jgi:hypothetical protein
LGVAPLWVDWEGAELVTTVVVVVVVVVGVVVVELGDDVELDEAEEDDPAVELPVDELDDDWADSSSESLAWAADKVVWADVTSFCRTVVLRDATVCPAVTCWFKLTSTADTVPATWKSAVAWCTGDAVPDTSRVLLTEAVVSIPRR